MRWLARLVDSRSNESLAWRMRARRFAFFRSLAAQVPRPLSILDIGGLQEFWESMKFSDEPGVRIVLLNLRRVEADSSGFLSVVADARAPMCFRDKEFDIVFSNSVIEHLGSRASQELLASEIRRVGRRYFVQTPNRNFPVEPHFALPLFQFLPVQVRVWLVRHFDISWYQRIRERTRAEAFIRSFRLLTKKELVRMFPGAQIYEEKLCGLTKSLVVYDGWPEERDL